MIALAACVGQVRLIDNCIFRGGESQGGTYFNINRASQK